MHKRLADQIAKAKCGDELDIGRLVELVSEVYDQFDTDRARYERAPRPMSGDSDACEAAVKRLVEQNRILDAALAHMVQGVAIFDAEERLVVCNRRYAEIYDFPPHRLLPGTHFTELVSHCLTQNQNARDPPAESEPGRLQEAFSVGYGVQRFGDGRFIAVACRPMQSGGWVTTHEDITEREELHAKLREQHEIVKEKEAELRLRNIQFDIAINNMIEGFCFF